MKRIIRQSILAWMAAAFIGQAAPAASTGDEPDASGYRLFKGTLTSVDAVDRTITCRGFWFWSKPMFHVGDGCVVFLQDKPEASFQDLRPGQRVQVRHRIMEGVKVASQITENNPTFTGHIRAINVESGTLTVKSGVRSKDFQAMPECVIIDRKDIPRPMGEIKVGHLVTVTYLEVGPTNLAAKIEQNSQAFSGKLEAIDADSRVIRMQHLLAENKFTLADNCAIVIADHPDGEMSDLQLGDRLLVHFEMIDGVRIANRIERQLEPAGETESLSKAEQAPPAKR